MLHAVRLDQTRMFDSKWGTHNYVEIGDSKRVKPQQLVGTTI